MAAVEGIAWIVYSLIGGSLFLFSIAFTRYFQNKYESEFFATLITILSLGLVFCTLALLPIDIFLVSSTVDQTKGIKKEWATPELINEMTWNIRIVYYVCYGLVSLFSFFFIPFAYFYYEEYDDDETIKDRVFSALKYTSFFVAISVLLTLFGLFLKPTSKAPKIDLGWFKKLITENHGEQSITFVIACLILFGMLVFIGYTQLKFVCQAPGLSLLPFDLIKGRQKVDVESDDIENRLTATRERQRLIKSKYLNRAILPRDQRELETLEDEEMVLNRRLRDILADKSSFIQRLLLVLRPFEFLLGVFLLCVTLVLIVSIFFTIVDKIAYSICGSQCGYVITHPNLFNPINYIFVKLSKVFPLDYIFMVCLIVYFFLATMTGIIHVGIRFFWINLYRIKKGSTAPQGLLVSAVLLTLSLLALNYTMTTTVAPSYAHFGSQVYCNQTTITGHRDCTNNTEFIVHCDIYGPTDICTPTVSSTMIDRIIVNTPFFGMFFYYSQWVFLGIFLIGFAITLFKGPRNNVDADLQELLEEEEEQEEGLQRKRLLLDKRRRTSYQALQ